MRLVPGLCVAITACAASAPKPIEPVDPRRPAIDTREGRVIGRVDAHGVRSFLGVPYAAPPVGAARWREAMPPRPHAPLDAAAFRIPCSQIPIPEGSDSFGAGKRIASSEDCLYLNVWIPPHASPRTDQLAALYSDWGMTCPTRRDARAFARLGAATFLYRFQHAPSVMGGTSGAFHGAELVYLFPSVFAKHGLHYDDQDHALAQLIIGYWARFAATGDPNGNGALAWPRYDLNHDQHLALDVVPSVGSALRHAQCDTWDQVGI